MALRVLADAPIQPPEAAAVVEVAQVRELVAERVDHHRVLQQIVRAQLVQPDLDAAVRVADAVAAADPLALRLDRLERQLEGGREDLGVAAQPQQRALARLVPDVGQGLGSGGRNGV